MKYVNLLLSIVALIVSGCGTHTGNGTLPLLTPPVKAAAPAAFGGSASQSLARFNARNAFLMDGYDAISIEDFEQRFFQSGPTNMYQILADIDSRIEVINNLSGNFPCLTQAPVAYDITPYGQTVRMYGQCYQMVGDNGFIQWGVEGGVTYLYVQVGAGNLAAVLTPAGDSHSVRAFATVGNAGEYNSNGTTEANWDSIGSYGVMELAADPSQGNLEMVAAGLGLGYCGIHIASDGANIYGEGSVDMGATCVSKDPICVEAADGTTAVSGACSVDSGDFAVDSIGRQSAKAGAYGASTYPAVPNIVLDGTATDSLSFGPKTPTEGVSVLR